MTRISKGRDGWQAKTVLPLGFDKRVLVISTYKTTGGVVTQQQVMKLDDHGCMSFMMFGDFSKRTMFKGVRCTEKTITEIHKQATDVSDLTMSEACKFYQPVIEAALANIPSMDEFIGVTQEQQDRATDIANRFNSHFPSLEIFKAL